MISVLVVDDSVVVRRLIVDETLSSEEFDRIFEEGAEEMPAAAAVGQTVEPPTGATGGEERRPGKAPAPTPKPSPA